MDDISRLGDEKTPVEASGVYLGRYRLCYELATGGMATVFLASVEGPAGFEKLAAVKRIHPHMAKTPSFVAMFLDEAKIASRISHANVCTVFDFGVTDGSYFIAMEYLVGETLARVMKRLYELKDPKLLAALPGIATRIIADLSEGLNAAHELRDSEGKFLGVVHRDVSPQNLFVTFDGVCKVVDFGVVMARERVQHTIGGQLKGKYAYLSPEQVGGANIDRRADVWGLGVVLWELLTLKRLFKRPTEAATLMEVLRGHVAPPSKVRRGVPPEFDAIVAKAMHRDVESRYPTARELGRDLLRVQTQIGDPVGLAEVAEWMGTLFVEEHARKLRLVEKARNRSTTEGPSAQDLSPVSVVERPPARNLGFLAQLWSSPLSALLTVGVVTIFVASVTFFITVVFFSSGPEDPGPSFDDQAALIGSTPTPDDHSRIRLEQPIPVDIDRDAGKARDAGPMDHADPLAGSTSRDGSTGTSPKAPAKDGKGPRPKVKRWPSGFVSISTPGGWAYVYKGGRKLGQTPMRARLATGRHVLRLRPFGTGPWRSVSVVVEQNKVARVVLRLDKSG